MNLTPPLPSSNSNIENLTETIFNLRENMNRLELINKKLYAENLETGNDKEKKKNKKT